MNNFRHASLLTWAAAGGLMLLSALAHALEPEAIQASFNQRYQTFFGPDSNALLPLPAMEKPAWQRLREQKPMHQVYQEPGKYYNSKVYVITLYQADDGGEYYLDATGGFWGMDELVYGPLSTQELGIQ